MSSRSYIDVRAEKLSATVEEKEWWRELLQNLARAQRQMSDPEKSVTEYFGVEVNGSRCVPGNQNLSDCLFRKSLKAFRALYAHKHLTEQDADSCDLLISMVGFSLEPVMHTVLTIRPKHVVFVFSKDSARFRPRIKTLDYFKTLINCHGEEYNPKIEQIILESTDTALVFSSVNNTIAQVSEGGSIAIDVTGGKKSMDVSAFLAASLFEKVEIYYVDYEEYDSAIGYPVWGSEFLNELDNPYKQFNVREEHLIKKHWNRGDFTAARQLAEMMTETLTPEVAKRYSLTKKRDRLDEICQAASCYDAWRRFEYDMAASSEFTSYPEHHEDTLSRLRRCSMVFNVENIAEQTNAELALELAVDRYMRGEDASRHGEWNRSALCYAQSVELLLRFCFVRDRDFLRGKVQNIEKRTLGQLKKIMFDDNPDYFSAPSLGEKIAVNIADERNALSHFQCFSDDVVDYHCVMGTMKDVVDELFEAFTKKLEIEYQKVVVLKLRLTFCSLNEDLELFKLSS